MHSDGPLSQQKTVAESLYLRAGLIVLGVSLISAAAWGSQTPSAPGQTPAPSEFVGVERCAACHEKITRGFADNPHHKLAEMHNGITCESCHGPGRAHVEGGGDTSKIFNPAKAGSREVNRRCLSCHASAHPDFEHSPHVEAGLSCVSCHGMHAAGAPEHLLKAPEPTLCYQCHTSTKQQFAMPFHHHVDEGRMQCSSCHDPHGIPPGRATRDIDAQNAVCLKCHKSLAGPFVHEHAVVKVEGCTSCHAPHGSANAHLLKVDNVNTLCLQCHSSINNMAPANPAHSPEAKAECTSCHKQIHGSNTAPNFLK